MQKYASTVRALNSEGIYIRNQKDMVRIEYGLFKGLQKLAATPGAVMSEKDTEVLEKARETARKNLSRFKKNTQKKMDSFASKSLAKFEAYGLKISYEGLLHKGKITFTITNDYLNRRGESLNLSEFKLFTAEALKLKKDFAKFFVEALNEIENLMNLSSMAHEGRGKIPENVPRSIPKIVNLLLGVLNLASTLVTVFVVAILLNVGLVSGVGAFAGISWLTVLGHLAGAKFVKFMVKSIRAYGFKGTLDYMKLKARNVTKVATALPSLDYQLGVIASCSHANS